MIIVNARVKTPVGDGLVNGFIETSPLTCLVQVAVTDENRVHLADANCWTPKATHRALFEFKESELEIVHEQTSLFRNTKRKDQ